MGESGESSFDLQNVEKLWELREIQLPANSVKPDNYSKSVKNQAPGSWSVEKLMKTYGSKPDMDCAKESDVTPAISGRSAYFVRRSASQRSLYFSEIQLVLACSSFVLLSSDLFRIVVTE
uniref:NAC domain-containing protein n=1 Tax=Angiostrongylus cantonensis TaxID=6313 RepID=A0A0K0DJZ9_ANGCA